jgi:hypothetical protein
MVAKGLFTKDDFQVHQMIIQIPGRGAMQMPVNPNAPGNNKIQNSMVDWHSVGTESITVPAGTFVCEHWRNDKDGSDVWVSDKVTPFGLVKQVSAKDTMVLTKLLTDVTDQIPGPVTKFDPQMMMQQMQQQRQSQQKQ